MRFQLELRHEPGGFALHARGTPGAEGPGDDYLLRGTLVGRELRLGEVEGRFLDDASGPAGGSEKADHPSPSGRASGNPPLPGAP
jgi:hypothetical protein